MGNTRRELLEKIEENTFYIIELNKQIKSQQQQITQPKQTFCELKPATSIRN